MPGLSWMRYAHKFCPRCNALVDRNETVCPRCGAQVYSPLVYKIMRALGLMVPSGVPHAAAGFMALIIFLYLISLVLSIRNEGGVAIMAPSIETLLRFGAISMDLLSAGEYWRILACGLFHIGLIHIAFNSMALVQITPAIESEIGSRRMFVLITLTQLTAVAGMYIDVLRGHRPSFILGAGASGWLCGLIGFGITYYHRWGRRDVRDFLVRWMAYVLVFGYIVGADNAAHLGGMAGGMALGYLIDLARGRRTWQSDLWDFMRWPCAAAWMATLYFLGRSILGW